MKARFLLPLALTFLPPAPAQAAQVVSLPVEQAVDRESVVAVARVKRRTTTAREVENDHADPRFLSGRLMEVTSRYELEWVRSLLGSMPRRAQGAACTERMDPLVSYTSTTTGLEHEVREGKEYIFFCRVPKGSGETAEVFRVESAEREAQVQEAVRAAREDARTSKTR